MKTEKQKRKDEYKIGVIGYPKWAKYLSSSLVHAGFDALHWDISDISDYRVSKIETNLALIKHIVSETFEKIDTIHVIGGFQYLHFLILAKILKKRIVQHWVGTDVLRIKQSVEKKEKKYIAFYRNIPLEHYTVADHLKEELLSVNIRAKVIPLIASNIIPKEDCPMPLKHTVLAYLPSRRNKFYGEEIVNKLAESMNETQFIIVGNDGKKSTPLTNVKYMYWTDKIEDIYRQSSILIRITEHDGLPNMVLEMLARGRWVIYSNEHPHTTRAKNLEEAQHALKYYLKKKERNSAGKEYILKNYSTEKMTALLKSVYSP